MYLFPILVIAVLLYGLLAKRETRDCRWREKRDPASDQSDWACLHCGATMRGPQSTPPKSCLRA
ncbi:hypothetical protein [uncultured Pelagimonas sp.]|uniref:hypothetical protein n=1 Tax=uncultured Pelagimonas sp. TaxID=1618102 RepID=UPI00261EED6E|nr:hypothetical protein [uncultured Pelagimonas sp.]